MEEVGPKLTQRKIVLFVKFYVHHNWIIYRSFYVTRTSFKIDIDQKLRDTIIKLQSSHSPSKYRILTIRRSSPLDLFNKRVYILHFIFISKVTFFYNSGIKSFGKGNPRLAKSLAAIYRQLQRKKTRLTSYFMKFNIVYK